MIGLPRKRRHLPIAALCVAASLAMPAVAPAASQRVGGHTVRWPSDASLEAMQPGATVSVSVRPRTARGSAVVSLARVTRSGKPVAGIAKGTLRSGTFSARVPAGRSGSYRLKVVSGKRFAQVVFEVQVAPDPESCEGDAQADLDLTSSQVRVGETVELTVTNTGTACLRGNRNLKVQANRNGTWTDVDFFPVTPGPVLLQPGEKLSTAYLVAAGTAPGEYRLVTVIDGDEIAAESYTVVA